MAAARATPALPRRRYRRLPDGTRRVVVVHNGVEGFIEQYTTYCTGCTEHGESGGRRFGPFGCEECGYTGKRRIKHFVPFNIIEGIQREFVWYTRDASFNRASRPSGKGAPKYHLTSTTHAMTARCAPAPTLHVSARGHIMLDDDSATTNPPIDRRCRRRNRMYPT